MMQAPPPGFRPCKSAPCSPAKPLGVSRTRSESFHVTHKVPVGDTPYVRAKHVQLVDKDPEKAIPLFWAAINAGDRIDSALKDMAIVMKQQNRAEEAIEAIKSLRNRCSDQAQESLDNILLDLYKRCGRLDDQVALLRRKLFLIQQGLAFNGKRTKTARSQGKKFQVSVEQEATRLLGNLGWALMQQSSYTEAEDAYRRALAIAPDNNKMCNLGICLMKQGRIVEAKETLRRVKPAMADGPHGVDSHLKAYERAQQMLQDLESETMKTGGCSASEQSRLFDAFLGNSSIWQPQPCKENHNNTVNPKPVRDKFGDENVNLTNQQNHQQHLPAQRSLFKPAIVSPPWANNLNINAPPFYSTNLVKNNNNNNNQLNETLKRTRSTNAAASSYCVETGKIEPAKKQSNSVSSLQEIIPNKVRRRSLSFDGAVDSLPDEKAFEDAIISAVLNTDVSEMNKKSGGGDGYGKRLRVFQDITFSLSPRA
ncbi:hypothetical protein V2J09_001852 [Rumex salicifolius]